LKGKSLHLHPSCASKYQQRKQIYEIGNTKNHIFNGSGGGCR
jgi:hypothetical protein